MSAVGADGDARQGVCCPTPFWWFVALRDKKILRLLGVDRSFQAIIRWVHRLADSVSDPPKATPMRVAVDETAVKIYSEWP